MRLNWNITVKELVYIYIYTHTHTHTHTHTYIYSKRNILFYICSIWLRNILSKWKLSQFSSVQSLSHVWLFETPWIAARQTSLSITNSRTLLKPRSIEWVMPSSHLILCRPLLLLPPIPPSIRVFSNESALRMRWPKYWSFSFSHQSFQWTPRTDLL